MSKSSDKQLYTISQQNLTFLSSKDDGFIDRCVSNCPEAPQDACDNSPNLNMMVDQLLSTPKRNSRLKLGLRRDSILVNESKDLEVNGEQQSLPTSCRSLCSFFSYEQQSLPTSCRSSYSFFSNEKQSLPNSCRSPSSFFPTWATSSWDPANMTNSSEMNFMTLGNSLTQTDSSCASPEGSALSISVSPRVSNYASGDKKQKNDSSILVTLPVEKATLKFKSVNTRWKSNKQCRNQRIGKRFSNGKYRGKQTRNQEQIQRKQTISRINNYQAKPFGGKEFSRSVSCGAKKAKNVNIRLGNNISPTWPISKNEIHQRKGNQNSLALKIPFGVSSLEETLKVLMSKDNSFFDFVTNKEGSRYLQKNLFSATTEQLWDTFNHLQRDFVRISQDVFGNYVVQKYLELGSHELRFAILNTLLPSVLYLSLGMFGSRVVQKLLEFGEKKLKLLVAEQFAGSIAKFVYDKNGNHVIQKIIQSLNSAEIGFVVDEISGQIYSLAMHRYGYCVIQRLLEKISRARARPLLNEIKQHTIELSKNQFGNYIIQWIIKNYNVEGREIVVKLIGRVTELSSDKYASNVIEQAFKRSNQKHKSELAEELFQAVPYHSERYPKLALLVNDKFGNYVIKTLLESSTGEFLQKLVSSLNQCGQLKKRNGNLVFLKVKQMLRNHFPAVE